MCCEQALGVSGGAVVTCGKWKIKKNEKKKGGGSTNQKPRQKMPIKTTLCRRGSGSVFSSGSGIMRMTTSVTTCTMPWPTQNHRRFLQAHTGDIGSQFCSSGRQMVAPPMRPARAQTAKKASKTSQMRWNAGSGKARRYWRRKVAFSSIRSTWYPSDETKTNCILSWISLARQTNKKTGPWSSGRTFKKLRFLSIERVSMWVPSPTLVAVQLLVSLSAPGTRVCAKALPNGEVIGTYHIVLPHLLRLSRSDNHVRQAASRPKMRAFGRGPSNHCYGQGHVIFSEVADDPEPDIKAQSHNCRRHEEEHDTAGN